MSLQSIITVGIKMRVMRPDLLPHVPVFLSASERDRTSARSLLIFPRRSQLRLGFRGRLRSKRPRVPPPAHNAHTHTPGINQRPGVTEDHLHEMFSALHGHNMQRPVPVCMLLNECLPLFLFGCPALSDDTDSEGGCFFYVFFVSFLCFLL